jgi:hypothetical protein
MEGGLYRGLCHPYIILSMKNEKKKKKIKLIMDGKKVYILQLW